MRQADSPPDTLPTAADQIDRHRPKLTFLSNTLMPTLSLRSLFLPFLLGVSWILGSAAHAAWTPAAAELLMRAGNTDDDHERQSLLRQIADLPGLDTQQATEAKTLSSFIAQWNDGALKFYGTQQRDKARHERVKYDFGVAVDSPLLPITDLYLGRMIAWTLIEDSTVRTSRDLAKHFKDHAIEAFRRYHQAFPENRIARMYLGETIPWPKHFASVASAPEWAILQREQLERLTEIIVWWIEHRQRSDGQFGGGWGDDCEMWRWWSSVLLGFDDPRVREGQLKFSRAAVERPHLAGGFNVTVTDVEHAAEDTTDNLVPLLVLEPDTARWEQWALKLADFASDVWTGRNQQGGRQFKSFYFSATEVSPVPTRALDVIANVGALHPALLVWQKTGDPKLTTVMTEWLDTWVKSTARAENGKPAGILPASIRWPDGKAAGADGNWWEPVKPGGFMYSYYLWPSVITEMTDALVMAYIVTNDEKYLAPIRSMAAIRLRALKQPVSTEPQPGTEAWCGVQLAPRQNANSNTGGLVKTLARLKGLTGTQEFDELLSLEGGEFVLRTDAAGRRELVKALQESAGALRVNFPGFTSEVRSTDRVMRFVQFHSQDYQFDDYKGVTQPKHELLYRMVTGDANAPRFPQMAVRWLTPPRDIAALVTRANRTHLEAELFHFGGESRSMAAELRLLAPGRYQWILEDTSGNSLTSPAPLLIERGRFTRLEFSLPSQQSCILKIKPASQ